MMNNDIEQNGRQPPASKKTPPTDPRTRNLSSSRQRSRVCRDYIWGICTKGRQCIFSHIRHFDSMKDVLKFCNDFQNRTGCSRSDCTYLHATREEKEAFIKNGVIPRVLIERYATISPNSMSMASEGIPPQMIYMSQPPPPPPPSAAIPVVASMPPPPPPAPIPLLLTPPPPPPPPPLPPPPPPASPAPPATPSSSTVSIMPVGMANSKHTGPLSNKLPVKVRLNRPPPPLPILPIIFDASKPPPPVVQQANGAVKRPAEFHEAGPSKVMKSDNCNIVDRLCDNCVQRESRVELIAQETQKYQNETVSKSRILVKNSDDYNRAKLLLKTVVSAELFTKMEEYIEGVQQPQVSDVFSHLSQSSSFSGGSQTQNLLFNQYLERVAGNTNSRVDTVSSSTVNIDMFLQSLSTLARTNLSSTGSVNDSPADLLQVALDLLRNVNTATAENPMALEFDRNPGPSSVSKPKNGLCRLNGPRRHSSSAANSNRRPNVSVPPPPLSNVVMNGSAICPSPSPSGAMINASGAAAGAAPVAHVNANGLPPIPSGTAFVVATYSSISTNGLATSPIGNAVEAAVYSSMVASVPASYPSVPPPYPSVPPPYPSVPPPYPSVPPPYPSVPPPYPSVPAPYPSASASTSALCPSGGPRGRAQISASAPTYIPYQPAVPPPNTRPYYAYPSPSTHVPNGNLPYHPAIRMGMAPRTTVRPPAASSVPPLNGHGYNPYAMTRYRTPPHYFPPQQ